MRSTHRTIQQGLCPRADLLTPVDTPPRIHSSESTHEAHGAPRANTAALPMYLSYIKYCQLRWQEITVMDALTLVIRDENIWKPSKQLRLLQGQRCRWQPVSHAVWLVCWISVRDTFLAGKLLGLSGKGDNLFKKTKSRIVLFGDLLQEERWSCCQFLEEVRRVR